eukprot:g8113.t1
MPGRLCFSCGSFLALAATTTLSFTAALDRRGKRGGRKDIDPYNVQQKMMAKSETRFQGSSGIRDPSTVDAAEEVEGEGDYNFFEEDDNTTHREAEQVQEEVGSNNKNKPAGRSEPPDEDSKAGLIFVAVVCVIAAYSWITGSSASASSSSSPAAGRGGRDLDAEAIRAQRLKKFAALESPRQEPRVELLCKKDEEVEKEGKSDATISSGRQATPAAAASSPATTLSPESNDAPHATPKPLRVFITCNSQLSKAVAALSPLPFTEEPFVFEDRQTATVGDLKTALFQRVVPGEISPEEEKNILSLAGLPSEEGQAGAPSVVEYTKKLCLLFRGRILNSDEKLLAESGFGKFGEDRVMFLYR